MGVFSFIKNNQKEYKPSHLSTIGFSVSTPQDLTKICLDVIDKGLKKPLPTDNAGTFHQLSLDDDIELFATTNDEGKITCFSPSFRSQNSNKVRIVRSIPDKECEFEGSFQAEAGMNSYEDSGNGEYPFIFHNPYYVFHKSGQLPQIVDLKLVAFAHTVEVFQDEQSYKAKSSEPSKTHMATQSFIPSGMFNSDDHPQPVALFTGIVKKSKILTNSKTKKQFYFVELESYAMTLDVLIDNHLCNPIPKPGNVLICSAWLTGYWS